MWCGKYHIIDKFKNRVRVTHMFCALLNLLYLNCAISVRYNSMCLSIWFLLSSIKFKLSQFYFTLFFNFIIEMRFCLIFVTRFKLSFNTFLILSTSGVCYSWEHFSFLLIFKRLYISIMFLIYAVLKRWLSNKKNVKTQKSNELYLLIGIQ